MPCSLVCRCRAFTKGLALRPFSKPLKSACVVALLAWPCLSASAVDVNDPRYWLERMTRAADKFNYEGTFVYRRHTQLIAMRIIHAADDKGNRERLMSLNGVTREIIRTDDNVTAILPDKERQVIDRRRVAKPFSPQTLSSIKEVEKFYALTLGGEDRTAGRGTRIVLISPRDQYRYGYRLWVDQETGLLLQSDLLNEHGDAIEQVMFTDIKLLDASPAVLVDEEKRTLVKGQALSNVANPDSGFWKVNRTPPGFVLAERYHQTRSEHHPGFEHLVYTDGLASVSVFMEKQADEDNAPFSGVSHMGAVNAYGSMLGGRQVTVVGEVPLATVQLIGTSISFRPQERSGGTRPP